MRALARLTWIVRRTLAVLRREGVAGSLERIVKYARIAVGAPSPVVREQIAAKQEVDRGFDNALGVDTGGVTHLLGLTIRSPNAALGAAHIAAGPGHFRNAMAVLDVDVGGFTFIDMGSGKGRALMLAAGYPFAAIAGVEFAEELHQACRRNLDRFGDPRIDCRLGDAAEFAFPETDLVVFMNNPFDRPVVERIARNLEASVRRAPRTVRVVYLSPTAAGVFAGEPWFPVGSASGVAVFGLRS